MLYRNVVTGAEFESKSIISAPDWITVGAETPQKAPVEVKEPAPAEPPKEEKKEETKKAAPKKTTKRTRK